MSQTNVTVPGDGSSGMGAGMIVGLVLAIIVLGFIVWYFLLNGGGSGTPAGSSEPLQSLVQSIVPSSS
jgi:hypothetical protein